MDDCVKELMEQDTDSWCTTEGCHGAVSEWDLHHRESECNECYHTRGPVAEWGHASRESAGFVARDVKKVTRRDFATIEEARADARRFVSLGGKVLSGWDSRPEVGQTAGWTGWIRVHDCSKGVEGTFLCRRCAGTGAFVTGSLNGKPTGPGGICFRCDGKGSHDRADRARNAYHDTHYAGGVL